MNRLLSVLAMSIAASALDVPVVQAQTFKVTRFEIGGEGGTDYVTAEPGTGRVFVSRGTHVMVVDGATGKALGDIPDTPRVHGVGLAVKHNHGFTTNGGDSTVTMFDLETLAVIRKIPVRTGGLDGIMYDDYTDRIILTNHSRPIGTAVALDANMGRRARRHCRHLKGELQTVYRESLVPRALRQHRPHPFLAQPR